MAFDITVDLDTPVSVFLKLGALGPRFLLESVEGGERQARYSFIGFGQGLDVSLAGNRLRVGDRAVTLAGGRRELLDGLREALDHTPAPGPVPDGLPLAGGLVGVTGFGLQHAFEDLAGDPAEAYQARYYGPPSILAFDHRTRRAALLSAGDDGVRADLRGRVVAALGQAVPRAPAGSFTPPEQSYDRDGFMDAVRQAKDHIRAGDIYQVVLSIAFSGRTDLDPFQVYRALRLLNPSPYLYYLDFGDLQVVGSSPEALVKLDGRRAWLRPIAGTRPRGSSLEEDDALEAELLVDPKENAEHVMLVDLARNDLGRVADPGTVQVGPYRTMERYSHVIHMVSGVTGTVDERVDAFDLFAACFPAGTVAGAPKIRASEIIHDLEPVPRGYYAGTVGYFGRGGAMDQAIAIRTLTFRDGEYRYQAGAGIVADSVPETEYEEVLAKAAVLRAALEWAEEGV